jgi:hypothetical protein
MEHSYLLVGEIERVKRIQDVNPHICSGNGVTGPSGILTKLKQSAVGSDKVVWHGDSWGGEWLVSCLSGW